MRHAEEEPADISAQQQIAQEWANMRPTGPPQRVDEPMHALPPAPLKVGTLYPGRVMRVLIGIREVAAIVALVLVSILMVLLLAGFARIANAVSGAAEPDPAPAVTGCPFGEEACGG